MKLTKNHKVGDRVGQWMVLKYVGAGGQGTVYHVRNGKGVEGVLKRFKIPPWEPRRSEAVNRLRLEVDLLRRLSHPNIVKLLDANIEQAWIVMEYLSNGTLVAHLPFYKGDAVAAL